MTDEDFKAYLKESGYSNVRKLSDGWAGVYRQIFNWALCVELDKSGYARRYDYDDLQQCLIELGLMNSVHDVPECWIRRVPEPLYFTIVGLKDQPLTIGKCMTEREILTAARLQALRDGEAPPVGQRLPSAIDAAVLKLNEKGRVFKIFDVSTAKVAFIARAETFGLGEEATKLVDSLRLWQA